MNDSICDLFSYQRSKGSKSSRDNLPDPFVTYASYAYPNNIVDVFRLCEYMWLNSGDFKMALQRVVRYFLTKIEFGGDISDKEKRRYREFFYDQLKIDNVLGMVGDDFICYGNSFTSIYLPFNRLLICEKCKLTRNIDSVDKVNFELKTATFNLYCPRCGKETKHDRKDLRSLDESRIKFIRWNVHELNMTHHFMSGTTEIFWQISPKEKEDARKAQMLFLRRTPWEVIEAIKDNNLLKFHDDVVYHMKEETIAGVQNRGWGIPRMLALFKDIYYVQLLKRYNEAIALDYIVPFRLITPAQSGKTDPLMQYDLNQWSNKITGLISEHRKDPAGWHTVPFPVNYQALGAEGLQLSPVQLIKQGNIDLMNATGIPSDLFQGTLNLKTAPTALRLFQATWPQLVTQFNGWLQWTMDKVSETFGWEPATASLQPSRFADDLDRKGLLMQLAAGQQISKQTAFSSIGLDPREEQRRMLEETKQQMEEQREFEENEMQKQQMEDLVASSSAGSTSPMMAMGAGGMPMDPAMAQQAGAMPQQGGGAPAGVVQPVGGMPGMQMAGQGGGPVTPDMVLQQAQELAQQLMAMPETMRKSQMIQLKRTNPMLHAQVKQIMADMSQQAATQGVSQMRQQMQGVPQ